MRIALIGDLQYRAGTDAEIRQYMEQVRDLHPDYAVSLGDMGCPGEISTAQGMRTCKGFLDILDCPKVVLLGNHDVEYLPGEGEIPHPMAWYREIFSREQPWQAIHAGNVLILCVSIEQQPAEGMVTRHALYMSEAQYAWAREQLIAHGNRPVIVCSHAPVAGSGLRCFPPIHVAATDDYIEHTFSPLRWKKLTEEFPQIRLWCSAHFHMGHDYDGAIAWSMNLTHLSCGVMTSAARDDTRQTRILDVEDTSATVCTLDHHNPKILRKDAVVDLQNPVPPVGRHVTKHTRETFIGPDHALFAEVCEAWKKAYIATEQGFLWEYDMELEDLDGSVCQERHVTALAMRENRLYWQDETGIWSIDVHDRVRYQRRSGHVPQNARRESELPKTSLQRVPMRTHSATEGEYIIF